MTVSKPCIVTIEGTRGSFDCGNEYVLDAAIAHGIAVPYNCRGGACGTCKAEVLEGAVDHGWVMGFAISDQEIAQGKCLICSSRPKSERLRLRMLNELPLVKEQSAILPAEHVVEVVAAHNLTPAVRCVTVRLRDEPPLRFDAGMYMEFMLEGAERPRPYSIATVPTPDGAAPDGMLSFLIGRHAEGEVSAHLHENVFAGDTLRLRGPYGTFRLPAARDGKTLMLAGGTGLAPLLSMAGQALAHDQSAAIELLFSVRTPRDVFALDELQRLASRHANFSFRVFTTRCEPHESRSDWERCRITAYLNDSTSLAGYSLVLIAGSHGFVSSCSDHVRSRGVSPDAILTEPYEVIGGPREETR